MANFSRPRFWIGLTLGLLAVLLVLAVAAAAWLIPQTSREDAARLLSPVLPVQEVPPAATTPARAVVGSSLESAGEQQR